MEIILQILIISFSDIILRITISLILYLFLLLLLMIEGSDGGLFPKIKMIYYLASLWN